MRAFPEWFKEKYKFEIDNMYQDEEVTASDGTKHINKAEIRFWVNIHDVKRLMEVKNENSEI